MEPLFFHSLATGTAAQVSILQSLVNSNPTLAVLLLCVVGSALVGCLFAFLSFFFSDPFVTTIEAVFNQILLSFGIGGAMGVVVLLLTQSWFAETSVSLLLYLVGAGILTNLVVSLGLLFFLRWLHHYLSQRMDLARASSGFFHWLPIKNELMQRLR
jgi:hypothetical protein